VAPLEEGDGSRSCLASWVREVGEKGPMSGQGMDRSEQEGTAHALDDLLLGERSSRDFDYSGDSGADCDTRSVN